MRRNVTDFDRQDVEAFNGVGPDGGPATPTIHLTLQGKGGVGKSLVASILAQYFRHRGAEIHCLDTDPVNQTFSRYIELGADHLARVSHGYSATPP
jgi:Mrp family chromosome partitioning ATPase